MIVLFIIMSLHNDKKLILMMASSSKFDSALAHALSCVGKPGLVLKVKQLEVLKCLYAGSDVFLWVPTGYGKSVCFQTLPFLFDAKLGRISAPPSKCSVVLVISPLVSLMVDQVSHLLSVVCPLPFSLVTRVWTRSIRLLTVM